MLKRRFFKNGKVSPPAGIKKPRLMKFQPTIKTKSGVCVRSKYEQTCADFLFIHNIKFQYEPLMLIEGRQFRPDFYLSDYNLFLEICGYTHMPYYNDRVAQKKEIYKKGNLTSIFISYQGRGSLQNILSQKLQEHNINIENKPE